LPRLIDQLRRLRRFGLALRGRDLWLRPEVHADHVRLGSEYGGWWVIPRLIRPESVVYSFGVGDDVTWDLAMIERFGVTVHAFDPTPRSVRWVQSQQLPDRFRFHPLGISAADGQAQFVMRSADPQWNAYNLSTDAAGAHEVVTCQVRRLSTIAADLGHDHVDVLKMDVEGVEYDVIDDMLAGPLRPAQLLIEYHYFEGGPDRIARTKAQAAALHHAGYRCFARSPVGHEFAFVRPPPAP
jgi:FkbM family methyltransferase